MTSKREAEAELERAITNPKNIGNIEKELRKEIGLGTVRKNPDNGLSKLSKLNSLVNKYSNAGDKLDSLIKEHPNDVETALREELLKVSSLESSLDKRVSELEEKIPSDRINKVMTALRK